MTHKTGWRQGTVKGLRDDIISLFSDRDITITEAFEALHQVQLRMVFKMLEPWEDISCPTCPKDIGVNERSTHVEDHD